MTCIRKFSGGFSATGFIAIALLCGGCAAANAAKAPSVSLSSTTAKEVASTGPKASSGSTGGLKVEKHDASVIVSGSCGAASGSVVVDLADQTLTKLQMDQAQNIQSPQFRVLFALKKPISGSLQAQAVCYKNPVSSAQRDAGVNSKSLAPSGKGLGSTGKYESSAIVRVQQGESK